MGSCQSCLGGNDSSSSILDRSPLPRRADRVQAQCNTRVRSTNPATYNRSVIQTPLTSEEACRQREARIAYERLNHPKRQAVAPAVPANNVQPVRNYNRPTFTLGSDTNRTINENRPKFTIGSSTNTWSQTPRTSEEACRQREAGIAYERLNQPMRQAVAPAVPANNVQPVRNYNRPTFTLGNDTNRTRSIGINENRPTFTRGSSIKTWVSVK